MNSLHKFRICLVLLLLSGFVTIVIKASLKLSLEETVFVVTEEENEFLFPTITICPTHTNLSFQLNQNNDKTFEDFYEAIEQTKDYYTASVTGNGWTPITLTDSKALKDNFNVTLDDVWKFSPRMDHAFPVLSICASIHPPCGKILNNEASFLMINVTNHGQQMYYYVEKSELGQSRHNSQFNWGQGIELINAGNMRIRQLTMQTTQRIKTQAHNCDDANAQLCQVVTDQYIVNQIQCRPKWIKRNDSYPICSGLEKFQEYLELAYNLSQSPILQFCNLPNCKFSQWKFESDENVEVLQEPGKTILAYFIPMHAKVQFKNEALMYSFSDFIADFGGYLGLFLGGSILSLYDICSETLSKCLNCRKL